MKIQKITITVKFVNGNRMGEHDHVFVKSEKISRLLSEDMGIMGEILREICGGEA